MSSPCCFSYKQADVFLCQVHCCFAEHSSEHFGHTVANITIHTSSSAKKQEGGGEGREAEDCSLKKKKKKQTARKNFAFKESRKNTEIPSSSVKSFALKAEIYFKRDYKKQVKTARMML